MENAFADTMTNRERIIRTLTGKPTDRPPFAWWLGFLPWGETLYRWRQETGIADLDPCRHFGFEPFNNFINVEYGMFPHFERKVLSEDDEFIVSIDWRGITRRDQRNSNSMPDWIAHPVKTPADWQRYKEERLQLRLSERLDNLRDLPVADAPVQVGTFPWGVFGTPRDLLGAEELLYAFYDEPDMLRDMMETHVTLWIALYEEIARRVPIDHIHIWEDMSGKNGSLISVAMIEEFMMPQYDRIARFARDHQVPVISVDSDGDLSQLVPVMMRHGINAFMPFEVQAGCDIERYRDQYPNLGIMGGLDKNALAKDKPAMHRELDKAARMFARGGYLAGLDHLIPPNVPWDNYRYFVEQLKKLVGI